MACGVLAYRWVDLIQTIYKDDRRAGPNYKKTLKEQIVPFGLGYQESFYLQRAGESRPIMPAAAGAIVLATVN